MYGEDHIARLSEMVRGGLARWGLAPDTDVRLLTFSENATFLLTEPASGVCRVLRVHRPGYHSVTEIESELAWVEALRRDRVVSTPAPLRGSNGRLLQVLEQDGLSRQAVLFEHVEGREPGAGEELAGWFGELGAVTARMHVFARDWKRPDGFVRKVWDFETALGAQAHWGDWRAGTGLDAAGRALIERVCARLQAGLAAYGTAPARFGLVHADLRLANLIVSERDLHVIDFDDCGLSWFVYDFAAAVSFIEHLPILPELLEAWVAGYRRVAPLAVDDVAAISLMVILRRLLLLAWIASHSETPTARELGVGFTEATLRLCEDFLSLSLPCPL
jgi:Ser/Thr protein kinase RdoA (MazF antagonist)